MPQTPLISVVVPTRNRADTLVHTLKTIVNQHSMSDQFEIIVSDNNSSPDTKKVVDYFSAKNLRYVRSDKDLCMSENYELGVSQAIGKYIMVVGDDDGLISCAISHLTSLIEEYDAPPAISL